MAHQQRLVPAARPNAITVLKQTSPFDERVTRNGIQRDIHVVIKNSPFNIQLGVLKTAPDVDLNHVAFEASLLYDTEGDKGVDFVKVKPIEYKCVPNEHGDQVNIELRIKVLTSQHEDMFFKVSIQGFDPVSKQEIPHLRALTAPIKVISKPEQLKKRQPPPQTSKKRTVNDMVVDAVTRIEKQQAEHTALMERLLEMGSSQKRPHVEMVGSWETTRPMQPKEETTTSTSSDFETTFISMLKSFAATDPNSRAEKVRRITRSLNAAENEHFSELVDMLTTEGLGQDPGREAVRACTCTHSSSKHNEMDRLDNIFFSSMMQYGANTGVLHPVGSSLGGSVGLGGSIDPESSYPDFLSHSPLNHSQSEFLL